MPLRAVRSRPGRRAPARPPGEGDRHREGHPETGDEAPSSIGGLVRAERGLHALGRRRAGPRAPPAGRAGPARRTTSSAPTARRRAAASTEALGRDGQAGRRAIHQDRGQRGRTGQHDLLRDRGAGEREPGHPASAPRRGSPSAARRAPCRPVGRHQLAEEPAGRGRERGQDPAGDRLGADQEPRITTAPITMPKNDATITGCVPTSEAVRSRSRRDDGLALLVVLDLSLLLEDALGRLEPARQAAGPPIP